MQNYCLVADLLGFQNLILNLPHEQQLVRVAEWIHLVERAAKDANIFDFQMISDTVFAGAEFNESGLSKLIIMMQYLLREGIDLGLPVRGAISAGEVTWGAVSFGRPIVDAYQLSNQQNWIGACLHESIIQEHYDWKRVVLYPVPMKNGPVMLRGAISWRVPSLDSLILSLCAPGLTQKGEIFKWDWVHKVQNTTLFGIYLQLMSEGVANSPSVYRGLLPISPVEAALSPTNN